MKKLLNFCTGLLILFLVFAFIFLLYSAMNGSLQESIVTLWQVILKIFNGIGALLSNLFHLVCG